MSDSFSVRVALGGDHAGFHLKKAVATRLSGRVTELLDCGTHSEESCDYPDFAIAVARQLIQGKADRGIVVCGSGVGVSVAANKIPGIRAAICHDTYSAHQGVEHDLAAVHLSNRQGDVMWVSALKRSGVVTVLRQQATEPAGSPAR